MKKYIAVLGILAGLLVVRTVPIYAQTVDLDAAIRSAAGELASRLEGGSKIAVLHMRVNSEQMTNYLIEELISVIVNQGAITVVDRSQLGLIEGEMNFQMSGEVSDASAQEIGKKLGAESIVTGSFEPLGDFYRLRIRVIDVETAAIQLTYSANVRNDRVVLALMGSVAAESMPVQAAPPPQRQREEAAYKAGDTGPAGGIVFYDKGVFANGWRYMEAAPADLPQCQWGAYRQRVITHRHIGGGKENTSKILLEIAKREEQNRAAQLCDGLREYGFDDWFLPSVEEMNILFTQIQRFNKLNSFGKAEYWTSTEKDGNDDKEAYVVHMGTGKQSERAKNRSVNVRPVRRF